MSIKAVVLLLTYMKNASSIIAIIIGLVVAASSGSRFVWVLFVAYLLFLIAKHNHIDIKQFFNTKSMPNTINIKNTLNTTVGAAKRIVLGVVGVIVLIMLLASSLVVVDAGYTGVYSLFGKVRDGELSSGFHVINPFARVTHMSIRTDEFTMSIAPDEGQKQGNDAITALTKEGLNVDLDITVLYRLDEQQASEVYRTVGLDYTSKIIRPAVRSTIREVIAQFEAKDIYSEKRAEAAERIATQLQTKLEPRGIVLEDVLLRNVVLPPNLANAIQEKLQAEQEAQKYDFLLQQAEKEAERKRIEAEGQRDAQAIINQSLSTNYLYYRYISELKDREGTIYVPVSPSSGLPLFRGLGE